MGRGKGHYNKDRERERQQRDQYIGKYKNYTTMRLREKLTGEPIQDKMEKHFAYIYENHYNSCNVGFVKKILEKNRFEDYKAIKNFQRCKEMINRQKALKFDSDST